MGAFLAEQGAVGRPVLLAMPPGLDFVVAFLGCLDGGAIAVPCHPPRGRRGLDRLRSMVVDARPSLALVDRATLANLERRGDEIPELAALPCFALEDLEDDLDTLAAGWSEPPHGEGLALLQYTSGSTSEPKGVRVGHRHLLHNEAMIRRAFGQGGDSRIVGWLPLYHDMGLIGNVLQPLMLGASCILMSPVSFLQRPARWLEAISRFRATTSGGPSFAYDLCARRISEEDRAALDLSSWTVAFDGAEPVRAATHDRFAEVFEPCGFDRKAFFPCYGLAEATLFVSGGERSSAPTVADFVPQALEAGRAEEAPPDSESIRRLVGCGHAWGGQRIEIVDPATRCRLASSAPLTSPEVAFPEVASPEVASPEVASPEVAAVGEIWIQGESVADGYWRREDDPAEVTFGATLADDPAAGPFLRTGDLGFLRGGELFVCGRLKELIIIRGRNHLPIDLEETVRDCHEALRPEVAAFSVDDGDDERLVMVAEVRRQPGRRGGPEAETVVEIVRSARQAVAEHHQIELSDLLLIRTGTLPKTTSGKVRRRECRRLYLAAELPVVASTERVGKSPTEDAPRSEPSHAVPLDWVEATARVLRCPVDQVSTTEPLTVQGLDSLAALELQQALRPLAGAFELVELLEGLSLEDLAARRSTEGVASDPATSGDTSSAPPSQFPLTPAQRDLWSLHQRVGEMPAPASGAAQIAVVARLGDPRVFERLTHRLAALASRHPALRATVAEGADGPALSHDPGAPPEAVRVDATDWTGERLDAEVSAERFRPIDLSTGPLWRLVLFERGRDSRLLLVAHHLVADFWTLAQVARSLAGGGRPEAGDDALVGEALAAESSRLARAITRRVEGPTAERQRVLGEYWGPRLGDPTTSLLLSTDRPRSPQRGFRGQRIERQLTPQIETGIAALARRLGTTPFAVLLATTAQWLARLGGGSRPRVGVPLADRDGAEGGLLGCFVDPLPMAVEVAEASSFTGLVKHAALEIRQVMAHRGWSVDDLAQRFDAERDPSRPSIFQVMLVDYTLGSGGRTASDRGSEEIADPALGAFALGRPGGRLELAGGEPATTLDSLATTPGGLGYELVVATARIDGRRFVQLDVDPQLFDVTTAQRWLDLWVRGLVAGLERPDAGGLRRDGLGAGERHQLTVEWQTPRAAATVEAREIDVPTAILRHARETPEVLAVSAAGGSLSWGELAERSARLAVALRRLGVGAPGVGREALVALGLGPSIDWLVVWLAVWRAGGAVLPIDPQGPPRRLAMLLAEARPVLTVTTREAVVALGTIDEPEGPEPRITVADLRAEAPSVDDLATALSSLETSSLETSSLETSSLETSSLETSSLETSSPAGPALDRPAVAEQLAYVIHTSGSTGRPKRVGIPHRGLRRLVAWHVAAYAIGPEDRASQVAAPTFDAAVWELWPHLAAGASIHLAEPEVRSDPRRLVEWLVDEAVTVAFLPTPVAEEALAEPWPAGSALRILLTGGDRLQRAPAEALGFALVNHYGPTEASVVATCGTVPVDTVRGEGETPPPIGRPLPGTRAEVVDPRGDLCPLAVPGQLTLAGDTLARGYLGDPASTAARFVPDPRATVPGGRRYLTGDRVRWRTDGQLDFLGRLDHQVQLRGRRIELGEIEAALARHPRVREAVVSAVAPGGSADAGSVVAGSVVDGSVTSLVAWVLLDASCAAEETLADLSHHLAEQLPAALRPRKIEARSDWPRTPHGKIDRRVLAVEAEGLDLDEGPAVPARGAIERWLQELVADVLDRPRPGLDDDFFALGGHSLLAARLLTRIRQGGGVEISLADLFETPTVRGLAERVRGAGDGGSEIATPITDLGVEGEHACGPVPLTAGQERIWFLDRLQPGWPTHNVPVAITLEGSLDRTALERAVRALLRRHPMLRARLVDIAGRPHQQVVAAATLPRELPELDLRSLPATAVRETLDREARRPFDLEAPSPLVRVLLARLADDRAVLLLVAHHLVFDGTSLRTVLGDLATAYGTHAQSVPVPSPPGPPPRPPRPLAGEGEGLVDSRGGSRPGFDGSQAPPETTTPNSEAGGRRSERAQAQRPPTPGLAIQSSEPSHPETTNPNSESGGRRSERAQAQRPPTPGLDRTTKTPPSDLTTRPKGVGEGAEPTPGLGTSEAGTTLDPPTGSRYLAYAHWQREATAPAQPLEAWRQHLEDAPPVLDLPTRRPRPDRRSPAGRRTEIDIPPSVTQAVADHARRSGATRFLVQLAACAALLRRLTGVGDLVLGVPRIHRPSAELENVVGLFLDALVLRLDASGNPTFDQLVDRARGELLAADRRADVPFETLVEALQPTRDPRVDPVFQVLFSSDEAVPSPTAGGVRFTPDLLDTGTAKLDLSLLVFLRPGETGDREVVVAETRRDLVDGDEARRWLTAYGRLLTAAVERPERRLADLDPWSRAEHHQLTVTWQHPAPATRGSWLDHWRQRVEERPGEPAVEARDKAWTHRELHDRAMTIAHRLRTLGLTREELVAVSLGPTPERLAVLLGILLAGGAYLPLDPEYPAARRRWMLDDSGARWWVAEPEEVDGEAVETGRSSTVRRLAPATLINATEAGASLPLPTTLPETVGESLAYRIYTSGSTGRPKGVDIPHGAVDNFLASMAERPGLAAGDRLLAATPLSFDISVLEHFLPLVVGGTVVLAIPGSTRDADVLAHQLETSQVHFFQGTPTTLRTLPETSWGGQTLRLGSGGEPLAPDLADSLAGRAAEVWNLYGPTETTVWSSADRVRVGQVPTLGRPIAGTTLHALDREGLRLGVGAVGELHIGGVGLARGYHGRPATTAERFVPDPWSREPGARLYATGDRVRRLPDGRLEGLGRLDQQVKVRGVRIEVGEIEAALRGLATVAEAVVTMTMTASGRPGGSPSEARLVAHVRTDEGTDLDPRSLRDALLAELPRPLVPTVYRQVSELPRTPSGKIDRARLAREGAADTPAKTPRSATPPRNPLEATIHRIWSEVLERTEAGRVEAVGVEDDFFELGGHSLLAARVLARLRSELGVDLPLLALFEHPTIAGLAEAVRDRGRDAPGPIARLDRPASGPFEALPTLGQRRLWLLDQLSGGGYVLSAALRLRGPLHPELLEAALASVVARHEALRTGFRPGSDEPVQWIEPATSDSVRVPLATVDLSGLPRNARRAVAEGLAVTEARRRFALANPPLLRWRLLDLGDEDRILVFAIHHLVADGGSLEILVREVARFYDLLRDGSETQGEPPPSPTRQPADFAHWQRHWLARAEIGPALEAWRRDLAEVPTLDLPTDRLRPQRPSTVGGLVRFGLGADLHQGLQAVARRHGATLFMTLQAVFQALIGRLADQRDFAVGSPRADRPHPELEAVIGLWVETLVIRADLSGRPSFGELLNRVRQRNHEAFARPRIPFEKLVEVLAVERGSDAPPIFQVLLGWQEAPLVGLDWPGLEVSSFEVDGGLANFDLALILEPAADGGLTATWEYRRELFDRSTLARLGRRFERLAKALVHEPSTPYDAASWLDRAERHQLLHEGSGEPPELAPPDLLTPFLAVADHSPDRLAGVDPASDEHRSWTFGQLRDHCDRLAEVLESAGVGPGRRVLVLAEGGFAQAVSLLAVLRCGAAFLALDPEGSATWSASVLDEARPALALVEGRFRARLSELGGAEEWPVVVCDSLPGAPTPRSPRPARDAVDPELPAYLVYTSGSSGRPKGIVQSRRTLAQLATWLGGVAGLRPGDRLSRWSAVSYDAATVELFAALGQGAAVVQASPALRSDPRQVPDWLREGGVTHFQTVPSVAREVLVALRSAAGVDVRRSEGWSRDVLPELRWLALAGEVLTPGLAADWRRALGSGGELINLYGPTESILASYQRLDEPPSPHRRVPVGRAIPGRRLSVVDGRGRPSGVGMPGEVVVEGEALTAGYWRRPAATAVVFRPAPGGHGARRYHTGDRGRFRTDGGLEFLGRRDAQIKLRGVRVEPAEVEAVLRGHPKVADCVVVPWIDAAGGVVLWAYTTPAAATGGFAERPEASDAAPRIDAGLRAYAAAHLPRALVPASVVVLAGLPRTRNGKTDRRSLPAPESLGGGTVGRSEPPRGVTEQRVAAIWRRVLDREVDDPAAVGRDDDFFQLGGHSLLVTRLLREVTESTGVEVPLRDFFERPTVAALAARIDAEQGETQEDLETILRTIEDVEQLSEDEVSTLLGVAGPVEGGP